MSKSAFQARLDALVSPVCPRCTGPLGAYPALSRADNATDVCSSCGTDEAMQDFAGGGCAPVSAWPLV